MINYHEWNKEEKEIIDDTYNWLNNISKSRTHGNQFVGDNKIGFQDSTSNGVYSNKKPYIDRNNECSNWRKKQVNSSEYYFNKNNSHHSSSKNIDRNENNLNNFDSNKEFPTHTNKETDKNFKKEFNNKKSDKNNLNYSSIVDKFKTKHGSIDNLHVSEENDSILRPNNYRSYSNRNNKFNWRNQPDGFKNQNGRSFQNNHNHFNNTQRVQEGKNSGWQIGSKQYQNGNSKAQYRNYNLDSSNNSDPNNQNNDTKNPTHRSDNFHSNSDKTH